MKTETTNSSTTEKLYNRRSLAEYLDISQSSLDRLLGTQELPVRPIRLGRLLRFDPFEVKRVLREKQEAQ